MSDQTWGCRRCDKRWAGLSAAHCSACHVTFASVRIFDEHHIFSGVHMTCKPPLKMRGVTEVRPDVFGRSIPRICPPHGPLERNV